ncbi:MAG: hypothetical protein AAGJ10_20540, partial [Bacteroidota bacterium]
MKSRVAVNRQTSVGCLMAMRCIVASISAMLGKVPFWQQGLPALSNLRQAGRSQKTRHVTLGFTSAFLCGPWFCLKLWPAA